jgi:peptide/nickel transport system substrate-binding protein
MHCIVYHTVNNLRRLVLSLIAVCFCSPFLVGFAAPTAGLAQVRAQTPSLIALPRSETVYMGGAV